jgi:hypothetical protein
MQNQMNIYYDEEGDFLELTSGDISNCYFNNIDNGIFEIVDKTTKIIKGFVVHNFKKKTKDLEEIKLTLPFNFNICSTILNQ